MISQMNDPLFDNERNGTCYDTGVVAAAGIQLELIWRGEYR